MKKRLICFCLFLMILFSCFGCSMAFTVYHPAGIMISDAFHDPSLPEDYLSPYEIAYYRKDATHGTVVDIVPISSVERAPDQEPLFPRTHFFDQYLPEGILPLLDKIDYAIVNGYSRFVFPLEGFTGKELSASLDYLAHIYRLDGFSIQFLSITGPSLNGEQIIYMLTTLPAFERSDAADQFLIGLEEAKRVVAMVPEGSTQAEAAVFLYSYLTENTYYDYDNYYDGDWRLLYDALITKSTVCAGFGEALYYLFNLAGINCITVDGYVSDAYGDGGYHLWNIAEIDGTYYQFDATWDSGLPTSEFRFFGVSTEEMLAAHSREFTQISLAYLPECTASLLPAVNSSIDTEKGYALHAYLYQKNIKSDEMPCYRLTDVKEDGDNLTATVYVMTDALHGEPVTIHCKVIEQDGQYYVSSVEGLE